MERIHTRTPGIWAAMSIALMLTAAAADARTSHVKKHSAHRAGHRAKARVSRDPFRLPKGAWINRSKQSRPNHGSLYLPPLVIAKLPADIQPIPGPLQNKDKTLAYRHIQAPRRMAGVVFADNGVYAVLDTGGDVQMVKPGDRVNGGRVISIESDGLTIRTDSQQMIRVPLTSAQGVGQAYSVPDDNSTRSDGYRSGDSRGGASYHAAKPDSMFD